MQICAGAGVRKGQRLMQKGLLIEPRLSMPFRVDGSLENR